MNILVTGGAGFIGSALCRHLAGDFRNRVVNVDKLTYRDLITFVADRPGHDRRYAMDASKLERDLGWVPEESFETGLARTVDWYVENRWSWEPIRSKTYAGERLGETAAAHCESGSACSRPCVFRSSAELVC